MSYSYDTFFISHNTKLVQQSNFINTKYVFIQGTKSHISSQFVQTDRRDKVKNKKLCIFFYKEKKSHWHKDPNITKKKKNILYIKILCTASFTYTLFWNTPSTHKQPSTGRISFKKQRHTESGQDELQAPLRSRLNCWFTLEVFREMSTDFWVKQPSMVFIQINIVIFCVLTIHSVLTPETIQICQWSDLFYRSTLIS